MLNRLSVSALLKTVILTTAFCIVIGFSLDAWESWKRLQMTSRISVVAEASASLFKAMHNLGTDGSTTNRLLNSDQPVDSEMDKYLRGLRGVEMPSMSNALELLPSIEFAQQTTHVPELERSFKALTRLQKEFWDEMNKPKASRRPTLGKEYMETTAGLLDTLDKLSAALVAAVNHQDAVIGQLLAIKQIAWLLRNTGGEASLLISNGLAAGALQADARLNYTKLIGGVETAWHALELTTSGMKLPETLSAAMAATKTAYFEPSYLALPDRLLAALIAGEKPELTANRWSPVTVGRLSFAVVLAEATLEAARDHTSIQHSQAFRSLMLQLVLLVFAVALTVGAMVAVSRRVIEPLHRMRDAMLKVASGDLTVDTGHGQRQDEIGALAGALETFKHQATDKMRIEHQEQERNEGAIARQKTVDACVSDFEGMVRQSLQQLEDASSQMRATSSNLSAVSRQTNERVQDAEKASGEASMSVESVASASEQLSASINDISQQAAHAAGIASRAVNQARDTIGRPHRRGGWPHQHHCSPNQPAGVERHDRSRARRRSRPRLCGGGVRSQIAGQPDRQGDRGNFGAGAGHSESRRRSHRRHQGYRQHHRRSERGRDRHCGCGRGTGRRHSGDHPQHAIRRARHQERFGQHQRHQNRCRCRRRGGGEC